MESGRIRKPRAYFLHFTRHRTKKSLPGTFSVGYFYAYKQITVIYIFFVSAVPVRNTLGRLRLCRSERPAPQVEKYIILLRFLNRLFFFCHVKVAEKVH